MPTAWQQADRWMNERLVEVLIHSMNGLDAGRFRIGRYWAMALRNTLAGQQLIGLKILRRRLLDDLRRQGRRRTFAVPGGSH